MHAVIYADASGALLRLNWDELDVADNATALEGVASTLEFDTATNADLIADLLRGWQDYALLNGVLTCQGQAVTVNAPSVAYTQRQQVYRQTQQVLDDIDTYLAISSPTNAQTVAMFREVLRVVRYFLRRFVLAQID